MKNSCHVCDMTPSYMIYMCDTTLSY